MSFCFSFAVKNSTLIIAKKIDFGVRNAPKYEIDTKELYNLEINEAYRNVYQSVVLQWQDISSGVELCAIFVLVVASLVII